MEMDGLMETGLVCFKTTSASMDYILKPSLPCTSPYLSHSLRSSKLPVKRNIFARSIHSLSVDIHLRDCEHDACAERSRLPSQWSLLPYSMPSSLFPSTRRGVSQPPKGGALTCKSTYGLIRRPPRPHSRTLQNSPARTLGQPAALIRMTAARTYILEVPN